MNDEPRRVIKIPIWVALLAVTIGMFASRWTGMLIGWLLISSIVFGWGMVAISRAKRSDPTL